MIDKTSDHILACDDSELHPVLVQLHQSGFRLSGSRFFHSKAPADIDVGPTTDWDFCGQYGIENIEFLVSLGFKIVVNQHSPYLDDSACAILSYSGEHNYIQVVLRDDVDAFMSMFDSITPAYYEHHLWKSGPNHSDREHIQANINQLITAHKAGQQHVWHKAELYSITQS